MGIFKNGTMIAGIPSTDNATITYNSNNALQSSGLINKNSAPAADLVKYDWVGTTADYIAQDIEHTHPEYICYITDDQGTGVGAVYNTAQADARFFKKNDDTDSITISGLGMPSNTDVEDITVLATNTIYTAPANGWFQAIGTAPSSGNSYLLLVVNNTTLYEKRQIVRTTNYAGKCGIMMPVLAGEEVSFAYNMTDVKLRFFYAEGNPMPVNP